ncbi:hypothetical protein TNIN_432721 [Trichonephila inaurata madagascariensis]|uniref:Uncharacterized protein n=1 Tax=Trichonephila inaurata madagascariensis TaxID=2747483 RepID=A0A8X6IBR7_9ARAC|nr:hypothetical protein TNIN_432721 [Trichonephila inaurata madagascariensis]
MFRAISQYPLQTNVWRRSLVIQRVRLITIVSLTLIGSRFSALNCPHHTTLDDGSKLMVNLHIATTKLGKQFTNYPFTTEAHTLCFVDVGYCCSHRMF